MKLPRFKASKQFLDDLNLSCLAARLKNSKLPGLASQYIAEFQTDPTFVVYLRSKNPGQISPWQREKLHDLFEQERLPAIVAEGLQAVDNDLKQYDYADLLDEERAFAKIHGYAPFAYVKVVVIDDLEQKVLIGLDDAGMDVIHEHGWTVYWEKGRWQYGDGECLMDYRAALEEKPNQPTTPAEFAAALKTEMKAMAAQFEALSSAEDEAETRWEEMFPPAGAAVETDLSFLCGEWKLDAEKTAQVQKRLGEKASVGQCRKKWGKNVYRITADAVTLHRGTQLVVEERMEHCARRGNRFTIRHHQDYLECTSEYWCDGELLVDTAGLAYRRAS